MSGLNYDERLRRMLKLHEGIRAMPYRDTVGKLTIGVGRNLDDRGLRADEVDYLLENDIEECQRELSRAFPWFDQLDETRRAVLTDMCFNLGMTKLMEFHRTLAAIASGRYTEAANYMLDSKWADQVGNRAVRLANMMRTGKWYEK